jgi:hypothetical protein
MGYRLKLLIRLGSDPSMTGKPGQTAYRVEGGGMAIAGVHIGNV